MKIFLVNGTIVTGDGKTVLKDASLMIQDGVIKDIVKYSDALMVKDADRVIDARGKIVIPGVINHHTHGVTFGPLFPSGAKPLPRENVIENLNRHMLAGTTTMLCVDGFVTMEEAEETRRLHPINIKIATAHTPSNLKSAQMLDGSGLDERHRKISAEDLIKRGAVAIGEVGANYSSAMLDYRYIHDAVKERTGKEITTPEARELRFAVLSKYMTFTCDYDKLKRILEETGLAEYLSIDEAKKVVEGVIRPIYDATLDGLKEACSIGKKYDVPVDVHTGSGTMNELLVLSRTGARLIASHLNSEYSFEVHEAVSLARKLKENGVVIDVATLDSFKRKQVYPSHENMFALMKEGLVDIISTDYAGGFWDPILLALEEAVRERVMSLPQAIALATGNVAASVPNLAPNRGLIAQGRIADIAIVDEEGISKVDTVIIDGKITVEDGKLVYERVE